jgi:hypothetical protein
MMKFISMLLLFMISSNLEAQKTLLFEDAVYEPNIKTVQLYPDGATIEARLEPSVLKLLDNKQLKLEFDDLSNDADYYYVYFIHCNHDWTASDLRPNMYLYDYNEFEILDYEFSSESRIKYVHYSFNFPRFKSSGNYLAVVYRNQDKSDIVLSRRFFIYDNQVGLGAKVDRSASVKDRMTHQRVEVLVNYSEIDAIDPRSQFKLIVRQNERPDRTQEVSPTYIDENAKSLRYQNLTEENEFSGGNEFRFFDLSTVNFGGRNVENTTFINNKPYTKLRIDRQRDIAYLINLDINGKFYIRDLEGRDSRLTSEYVDILFTLDQAVTADPIYLLGAFNNWKKSQNSRMNYNPMTDKFEQRVILKQGWYDYSYETEEQPYVIERSFFETENLYEVFLYYRAMGARGDELIGYFKVNHRRNR